MEYLPTDIETLINTLDEEIPEVQASPAHSVEEIMFRSGRRSVVLYLKQIREDSRNP